MNATKNSRELQRADAKKAELVAKVEAMLWDRGFKIGKTGWHDLGTLRVAIAEETVGIYRFVKKAGINRPGATPLDWQVEMSLYGTPFSVIAATINAALNDSAE